MNKSTKQRNMELLGLSEGVNLKSLQNDSFKHLSESYEEQKSDEANKEGMTVEDFEQKSFKSREEDSVLYDLTNETFEIMVVDELVSEGHSEFKSSDDYENISTKKAKGLIRKFLSSLDTQ